jgi:hypothetical protein
MLCFSKKAVVVSNRRAVVRMVGRLSDRRCKVAWCEDDCWSIMSLHKLRSNVPRTRYSGTESVREARSRSSFVPVSSGRVNRPGFDGKDGRGIKWASKRCACRVQRTCARLQRPFRDSIPSIMPGKNSLPDSADTHIFAVLSAGQSVQLRRHAGYRSIMMFRCRCRVCMM